MRIVRLLPTCALAALLVSASCSPANPNDAAATDGGPGATGAGGAEAGPVGGGDAKAPGGGGADSGGAPADGGGGPGFEGGTPVDAGHDAGHDAGPPPPIVGADKCTSAAEIPITTVNSHFELIADTTSATHDISAPCAGDSGPDVFFRFTVSKKVFVYADTFGASFPTVLYLLSSSCAPMTTSTTASDVLCNDSACGASQSQIVALLNPGSYRLGVGGAGGASGNATVHFEFALAGSGAAATLPQGSSTQSGTTEGQSGNVNNQTSSCVAAGPEDAYWWTTCPSSAAGSFTASTCGGADWETVLELERPRASSSSQTYTCGLDSCGLQTALAATIPAGAGLHVLLVDGQSGTSAGAYSMQVHRP